MRQLTVPITRRRSPLHRHRLTCSGRCAWALLGDNRLLQGIYMTMVRFQKAIGELTEVLMENKPTRLEIVLTNNLLTHQRLHAPKPKS